MNFLTQYRGLPRQVYILSAARAVISVGMILVYPFLSLFLTSRLNFSETAASAVVVLNSLFSMAGAMAGGRMADKAGRKPVFYVASAATAAAMTAAGLLSKTYLMIPFVFIASFADSAILPAVSAMVLDQAGNSSRTECFSLQYLTGNIGCAAGPVISGLLFYEHTPWIFYSMAIAFFLTLVIVGAGVRDIYTPVRSELSQKKCCKRQSADEEGTMHLLLRNPFLLIFTVTLAVLTLCYINLDFMLPLQLSGLFGLKTGSQASSLIWTINGITVILLTPLLISLTKHFHQLASITAACILYAAGFGLYAFAEQLPVFLLIVPLWTSGEILISTGAAIYIAEQMPDSHKGRSMALYESARAAGKLSGPLCAGFLLSFFSYSQVWIIISLLCLAAAVVMGSLFRRKKAGHISHQS
ncbi:MAG: MFS transporter [Emergencia sp.]